MRVRGAATTEETYRLVAGPLELYITCVYRWSHLPAATFLSKSASDLGQRLGRNTLIIPSAGHEEAFWRDVRSILDRIGKKRHIPIDLESNSVYLIVSSAHPTALVSGSTPFVLCDVSELSSNELTLFFSKLLDLFNDEPGRKKNRFRKSPGKLLLDGKYPTDNEDDPVHFALDGLAEIVCVLDSIDLRFCCFRWPAQQAFKTATERIHSDNASRSKVRRSRERIAKLDAASSGQYDREIEERLLTAADLQRTIPTSWKPSTPIVSAPLGSRTWTAAKGHLVAIAVGVIATVVGGAILFWLFG